MPSFQRQDYELPRDPTESSRLETQHGIYTQNLGYVLHPTIATSVPTDARVADIGTGTGAWILELAKSKPQFTFEGLDISDAQFPPQGNHPSNCSFRVLNILDPIPEELKGRYDIVHARLLVCGLTGNEWRTVAAHALELLKPGGWIQWCESDFEHIEALQNESGASRDALLSLMSYIFDGLKKVGKFQGEAQILASTVEGAGFREVRQDVVSSDRVTELRGQGSEIGQQALVGIAKTIAKGDGGGGMDVEGLNRRCEEELAGGKVYWRWTMHNVIGRRPAS